MLKRLLNDLKEAIFSVMPITLLVVAISFFIGISTNNTISFLISAILLVLGISFFTFGANLSMVIIGERIGSVLIKSRKLSIVLIAGLIIGFVITVSEPDLMVLASQISSIPSFLIIGLISLGVGIFLMIGLFRIIKGVTLNKILLIGYGLVLLFLCLTPKTFAALSFDSGGVTTGPMSVPFIVALGYGFTKLKSLKKDQNDTFGLVGLASIGPIIVILILGLVFNLDSTYDTDVFSSSNAMLYEYMQNLTGTFVEVLIALTPILLVFLVFELFNDTLSNSEMKRVVLGLITLLLGLTIFLTGVETGFIKMGYLLGNILARENLKVLLTILGMIIGFMIVKAEPAVKVLVEQVSDLTEGSISKRVINMCLSIGVCFAVGISLIRVFTGISILYFVVPGYIITLILAYKTPDIFTAIAIDSGGAVSGPLTSSFLLPICIGSCVALGGNIMIDAFGIIGLVSLSPLIMIQLLGYFYQLKMKKQHLELLKDLNEEIIEYNYEVAL